MAKQLEKELENECLDWLNREAGFFFKHNSVGIWNGKGYNKKGRFDINGVSDICGVVVLNDGRGVFVGIEIKIHPNKPTLEQIGFIKKINRMGGFARCCYSIDEVKGFINEIRAS